jgi:restriction endonuclease Mrr
MITFVDYRKFKRFSSMNEVMEIEPYAFEYFSLCLLGVLGYTDGEVTKKFGRFHADDGVDITAKRNGCTVIAQCKRWQKYSGRFGRMPIEQVRALRASMVDKGADEAVFVSTLPFGEMAKRYAEGVNMRLIGPQEITNVLSLVNPAFGKQEALAS